MIKLKVKSSVKKRFRFLSNSRIKMIHSCRRHGLSKKSKCSLKKSLSTYVSKFDLKSIKNYLNK